MISMIWVVLFVALTGSHCGYGLPVRPTPEDYPHDEHTVFGGWGAEGALYAAIPALALVITAIVLIFGCTWCYQHKDCKPNEGTDNQLFTATAQHVHAAQRIHPPDSGFSEPANNNISEDNNNGPISLREMQNIANNNAAAYIISENEERNRISRESVVEFEPLPTAFIGIDPLEHCADWFGGEDFPRSNLQYLREIGRGWFGRVVEGEIEEAGASTIVAVKILNQNATLEDKARFLDESKIYRDIRHEHILAFIGKCLQEDPWILIFELCTMDLQQYLITNRPKMAILNEGGVPLRLMCDVTSALSYLHSRGYTYGCLWGGTVMVRGESERARAVLGRYAAAVSQHESCAPELLTRPALYTTSSEIWSLGTLIWEVCSWGSVPSGPPTPPPDLPCPYKSHLYQVMQLCWNPDPCSRPTAAQVHALINHLYVTHTQTNSHAAGSSQSDLYANNTDFEERWQRLKPNTIPKIDEHIAIIHAPSTSMTSHFTGSDQEFDNNTLSVDMDTAVSRSSSIMSDRDPLSVQIKSESLTNLHGSLEDVRNIYLTHNETAALECHQGNIHLEDNREREQDRSDASMDPWLKDIIAGSQDDVSYYKDVSDVIKNLDNILNSEKTSSSESSHQASPSRDNLSLDCKKECPMQSSLVKSPGITNFQNILDTGVAAEPLEGEPSLDDEVDRDTIGTLSHSFERHSDSTSQHTLENLTPDTPMKDLDVFVDIKSDMKNTDETQVENLFKPTEIAEIQGQVKQIEFEREIKAVEMAEVGNQTQHQTNCEVIKQTKRTENCGVEKQIEQKQSDVAEIDIQINLTAEDRIESHIKQSDMAEVEKDIKDTDKAEVDSLMEHSNISEVENLMKHTETARSERLMEQPDIVENENETKHSEARDEKLAEQTDTSEVENQMKHTETTRSERLMEQPDIVENENETKHSEARDEKLAEQTDISEIENQTKLIEKAQVERLIKQSDFAEEENQTIHAEPVVARLTEQTGMSEVENRMKHNEKARVGRLIEQSDISEAENQIKHAEAAGILRLMEQPDNMEVQNQTKHAEAGAERLIEQSDMSEVENQMKYTEKARVEKLMDPSEISEVENQMKYTGAAAILRLMEQPDNVEVQNQTKHAEAVVERLIEQSDMSKENNQMNHAKELRVERLMEQTDISEVERQIEAIIKVATNIVVEKDMPGKLNTALPNEVVDSNTSKLQVLGSTSIPSSVSEKKNEQSFVRKDCQTPCDNVTETRTDNEETKSIDNVREVVADSMLLKNTEATESIEQIETSVQERILPDLADDTTISNEGVDTLPSVTDDVSTSTHENDTLHIKLEDIGPESIESQYNYSKDETILISDLVDTTSDSSKDEQLKKEDNIHQHDFQIDLESVTSVQTPVSVQNITDVMKESSNLKQLEEVDLSFIKHAVETTPTHLPPEIVQITDIITPVHETESLVRKELVESKNENVENKDNEKKYMDRSDSYVAIDIKEQSKDSTVYMDLINTSSQIIRDSDVDNSIKYLEANSGLEITSAVNDSTLSQNDSTVYLDLPSFNDIKKTDDFLHMERMISSKHAVDKLVSSTPITSDNSVEAFDNTIENLKVDDTIVMSHTKVPIPETTTIKAEQRSIPDSMSPFESPSHKSHHTDTYDENSSVVLGPFENSSLDLIRAAKLSIDPVELPREELLAFSSNFSEINLETPSPLRDGNFLNEVPDIVPDDVQFDDLSSISQPKVDPAEAPSDDTEGSGSGTQKHVSPTTPPNSPGIFLASTSQQKYLVDIDLNNESLNVPETSSRPVDLNQIELQITSKLAMAENENNLNIEYSGPLTVEGLIEEGGGMRESDAIPELYLAGNCSYMDDVREQLSLDEECVKALRNELELKLPLAQVAAIEPQCEGEGEWQGDLPPPPEQLVVTYSGALSPIQEETGLQLSAYENDNNWNPSTRTESSESYPEPCNNSTDSATELPARDRTYSLPSRDRTYTLQPTDKITMSADSLNASPRKSHKEPNEIVSPVDDATYVKEEERESTCEHISQVSPFLVSPTTDTSETGDNGTRVSTLSRTTLPTDAKLSKPSETQCLSKATSIDSWCSNDTLYNVEENFDDLAMDPDVPIQYETKDEGNSESTDTLTHNDEDKDHWPTYIIHDSPSEPCETFSPDSITANDNYTYTKVKTEAAGTTPSGNTDLNDSTKNTQTKDLAYGTLMSGMPSFSNCTTELASGLEDPWRLPQPELVRRSPVGDLDDLSPPKLPEKKEYAVQTGPKLTREPGIRKMDSIEISCLKDDLNDSQNKAMTENTNLNMSLNDSPKYNYRNMVPSQTSTPLVEFGADNENTEAIPMNLPKTMAESSEFIVNNIPSFQSFQYCAEGRPQDLSSNSANDGTSYRESVMLEGESETLSRIRKSSTVSEQIQNTNSREKSSHSLENDISSEEFRQFMNSMKRCPQDLSSLIDASSLFLNSERNSSELALSYLTGARDQSSHSNNSNNAPVQSLDKNPPNITNLIESHELVDTREPTNSFLINLDMEDETEQPHSIIVTEVSMHSNRISPNRTYDAHIEGILTDLSHTYNSHEDKNELSEERLNMGHPVTNYEIYNEQPESLIILADNSPTLEDQSIAHHFITKTAEVENTLSCDISNDTSHTESRKGLPNGSSELLQTEVIPDAVVEEEIHVNGGGEKFATVNFLNETFEELIESNVDDSDRLIIDEQSPTQETTTEIVSELGKSGPSSVLDKSLETSKDNSASMSNNLQDGELKANGVTESEGKLTTVTEDFLKNEQKYATLDSIFPMLSDIRFTGPASEMMSTSFQDSPTSPTSPECEQDSKPTSAELRADMKEWDSDSESHSSNSSSGEFIWKDGDGHETSVVPSTHFDHQRDGPAAGETDGRGGNAHGSSRDGSGASDGSGDSGSGSEGDEVEFVPSSWDCRAEPSKSSLRSLEQITPDSKKRVVFKRQKYHCVYEYPREAPTPDHSPAFLPDLSTYAEWDPSSAEEAELCYGQLFASAGPLAATYPLRAGIAFGADYEEDFFISSSARPFEALGIMSTTSQFFPGMHAKRALLDRDLSDDVTDDITDGFPPPPSPLPMPPTTILPSLDFTTPDSGVEDITPGSVIDEEPKRKPSPEAIWCASASSSESASPSSPGSGGELGGLRHTRDKLKLDLPPSPHVPSPRHNRVFNFVLDKPKRRDTPATPLIMTDDTPLLTALAVYEDDTEPPVPEPTFSTFGKSVQKIEPEPKIVLAEVEPSDVTDESPKVVEAVKGEGTVLDSGDEDSGIESSSKATLERKAPNVS